MGAQRPTIQTTVCRAAPPKSNGGGSSKKRTRFLQRADLRSGMNGDGKPPPGVTVAGERRIGGMMVFAGMGYSNGM